MYVQLRILSLCIQEFFVTNDSTSLNQVAMVHTAHLFPCFALWVDHDVRRLITAVPTTKGKRVGAPFQTECCSACSCVFWC